jgi:hypothetical protein
MICVEDGTTFSTILTDLFPANHVMLAATGELAAEGLANGDCNVLAGGASDVTKRNVVIAGYDGPYTTNGKLWSKDPLALVTRQDDEQWTSFVYWVVSAIFYAEEQGIQKATASEMPITNIFGGRHDRFMENAIGAVGNYANIYNRNVRDDFPRGGLNVLNDVPVGPQHYGLPGIP